MSEEKFLNPFEPENFVESGGGLWDGKTVTVISAKTEIERLTYKDGSPVINERTGEPAVRNVLTLIGIADEEEKERRESYSAGALVPTADGEGFVPPEGKPLAFHKNSEISKFAADIKAGGFDVSSLVDGHGIKVSKLNGARFVFKGEPRHDKNGKVKVNSKGYEELKFWPVKFVGYKAGFANSPAPANGSALRDKAVETVLEILTESKGKLSRAELVRKVSGKLAGDPTCNKVLALVTRDDFHKDVPWTRDATGFALA